MVSSSTASPVLRSPPISPRFSQTLTTPLYPTPTKLRFRRSSSHRITASGASCISPERIRKPPSIVNQNSLYEVLGISIRATNNEIKAAYRSLAKICHPDAVAAVGDGGDRFIRIHDAYATLSDPEQRADYDRKLGRRRFRSAEPLTIRVNPWRNWETDQCW